jgi:hypothetical protein
VLCVVSDHEPLTLGPKFNDSNLPIGFGDVDRKWGTIVRDVGQGNLLRIVGIVPPLKTQIRLFHLKNGYCITLQFYRSAHNCTVVRKNISAYQRIQNQSIYFEI